LNDQQIEYIKDKLQEIGFTDAEKEQLLDDFNKISRHLSKQTYPRIDPITGNTHTVLESFFDNIERNFLIRDNITREEKRQIFLEGFANKYFSRIDEDPDTDSEDKD